MKKDKDNKIEDIVAEIVKKAHKINVNFGDKIKTMVEE
jgi:hypothetical protein